MSRDEVELSPLQEAWAAAVDVAMQYLGRNPERAQGATEVAQRIAKLLPDPAAPPPASSTPQGEDIESLKRQLAIRTAQLDAILATPPPATGLAPGLLRAAEIVREREREWFGAPGKTIEAVQYAATTAVFVDDIARALRAEAQAASGDATGGGEK